MKYLDASLFISAALDAGRVGEASRALLRRVRDGDVEGATSALTWDELAFVVGRRLGRAAGLDAGHQLLAITHLRIVPVDAELLRAADRTARDRGLRPRDAIHVASARRSGASAIVSEDHDLDGVPGLTREWV